MPGRQHRMLEIVCGIVRHSQLFHDTPRSNVCWHGEGNKTLQPDDIECIANHLPRAFGTQEHIRFSYAVSRNDIEEGVARMKTFFAAIA